MALRVLAFSACLKSSAFAILNRGSSRWIWRNWCTPSPDGIQPRNVFGLALHTRKTAVAVPSNVAEGTRRRTPGYIVRVTDALAEHAELETQIILADRLRYVGTRDMKAFDTLSGSVGRLTHGLLRSLEAKAERDARKEKG